MADIVSATDEMLGVIKAAWDAQAASIIGSSAPMLYTIKDRIKNPLPVTRAWARTTVLHSEADSYAHAQKYRNEGTLYVNVFVQTSDQAGRDCQKLAQMVKAALRAHASSGEVTFTRVRVQEAPIEGDWTRINVLSSFYYFERN